MVLAGLVAGVMLAVLAARRGPQLTPPEPAMTKAQKLSWRMPQLALLTPVQWSPGTKLGMLALRGYLAVGALLLVVKAVQLGGG